LESRLQPVGRTTKGWLGFAGMAELNHESGRRGRCKAAQDLKNRFKDAGEESATITAREADIRPAKSFRLPQAVMFDQSPARWDSGGINSSGPWVQWPLNCGAS
jgi:hypothetical protein